MDQLKSRRTGVRYQGPPDLLSVVSASQYSTELRGSPLELTYGILCHDRASGTFVFVVDKAAENTVILNRKLAASRLRLQAGDEKFRGGKKHWHSGGNR
jgi:hypothetical protein